jgi:ABC-2 type transport system ATP-binding protein
MVQMAIQTQKLTRDFPSVRAVDALSLDVQSGSVFGLLGPNGSGKTTTIRLLLGLLEPTSGDAGVLGYDVRTQADQVRLRSGALLEHAGLYERLSAEKNLEFYARIWRLSPSERRTRIEQLLRHLKLWERKGEAVVTWSRGMRQKLAVARTLLHRPALVFMDEPTAGLDPVAAAALHEDLLGLAAREGVTFFLTTHNLAEAEKLCAEVAVIHHGRLVARGSPRELQRRSSSAMLYIAGRSFSPQALTALRRRPEVAEVTLRDEQLTVKLAGEADVAPLVSLLVEAGGQIEEVRRGKATLEEVFLKLVEEEQ